MGVVELGFNRAELVCAGSRGTSMVLEELVPSVCVGGRVGWMVGGDGPDMVAAASARRSWRGFTGGERGGDGYDRRDHRRCRAVWGVVGPMRRFGIRPGAVELE